MRGVAEAVDGYGAAFEVLDQLQKRTGNVPLVVSVAWDPFVDRLRRHALPGGVLYQIAGAADRDAVNRLMEEVHDYRT